MNMHSSVYRKNEEYVKSKYCIEYVCDGVVLLYNFLTLGLISYKNEEFNDILEKLVELKYYVSIDYDESDDVEFVRKVHTETEINRLNGINSYVIMTTMDCNAKCYYCYEKDRKKIHMPQKIAEDTANYIIKHYHGTPFNLTMFGGEPLYNESVIDIVTQALKDNGCKYNTNIISNGFLFDKSKLEKYKSLWRLRSVQITLDGIYEKYNNVKKINHDNAFGVVCDNINFLINNNIKVAIRLNVSHTNKNDLIDVVTYLFNAFGKHKNLTIYTHEISDYLFFDDDKQEQTYNNIVEIDKKITELFRVVKQKLPYKYKGKHCMADGTGVCITPSGKITPCEHFSESEYIGSIYNDNFDIDVSREWIERVSKIKNLCDDCPLYPYCYKIKKCPGGSMCNKYIKDIMINKYIEDLKIKHEHIFKKYYSCECNK